MPSFPPTRPRAQTAHPHRRHPPRPRLAPIPRRDEPDAPKDGPRGAAVTVLKAAKSCFSAIVEVSGIVIPREETAVRPERPGLKVAETLAEPGDTVTAGQLLARLTLPEARLTLVAAPVAGLVSASSAVIGAVASKAKSGIE
jgi:HlyD family secretion protein